MRQYTFKPLSKRQLTSKHRPLCEFSKPGPQTTGAPRITLCRQPATLLCYWHERDGSLCTTPAFSCEACRVKVSSPE